MRGRRTEDHNQLGRFHRPERRRINDSCCRTSAHAGEYQWSSYGANAQGRHDPRLCPHPLYTALGVTAAERQHAYRELFRHHLDNDLLHEIRDALNHELVLGRSYFKDKIEQMTQRKTRMGSPGRPCVKEAAGVYYID